MTILSDAEALLLKEVWLKMCATETINYILLIYSTLATKGLVKGSIDGSISITLAGEALLCSKEGLSLNMGLPAAVRSRPHSS